VGTPPTGFGFGWIFIDDPIKKREEAESEVYREKVWDWYTDDLYTRLEPGGKMVLTLTRWHHDDLAARAIASEPDRWRVLKLPALAEENDPIGREVGEALWPERFTAEALQRIKGVQSGESGAYAFEALYQQNPTPREGAFFKVSQLEILPAAPANLKTVRAWDLAASTKGDYTVGAKLGKDDAGLFYILDIVRGQWLPDERNRVMLQTAALDGRSTRIRLAQDPGAAGVDQVQALTRMLAGYTVKAERVSGSKEVRADGLASQINAGNVKIVKGDWNRALIEELRTFPLGKNDDQVDSVADGFNELSGVTDTKIRSFRM
jgi:predicted phage terminase large subunit-like protein